MEGDGRQRTFEALFCAEVDLLGLRDLFEQFLDDYSVVVPYLAAWGREGGRWKCMRVVWLTWV